MQQPWYSSSAHGISLLLHLEQFKKYSRFSIDLFGNTKWVAKWWQNSRHFLMQRPWFPVVFNADCLVTKSWREVTEGFQFPRNGESFQSESERRIAVTFVNDVDRTVQNVFRMLVQVNDIMSVQVTTNRLRRNDKQSVLQSLSATQTVTKQLDYFSN
jgi:hypothetical protein